MKSRHILIVLGVWVVWLVMVLGFTPRAEAQAKTVALECEVHTEKGSTGIEMFLDTGTMTGFYVMSGHETTLPLVWNLVGEWLFVAMTEKAGPVLVVVHASIGTGKSFLMLTDQELDMVCTEVDRGNA